VWWIAPRVAIVTAAVHQEFRSIRVKRCAQRCWLSVRLSDPPLCSNLQRLNPSSICHLSLRVCGHLAVTQTRHSPDPWARDGPGSLVVQGDARKTMDGHEQHEHARPFARRRLPQVEYCIRRCPYPPELSYISMTLVACFYSASSSWRLW
jgi:hypothetical protein